MGVVKYILVEKLNELEQERGRRRPHTPDTLASTDGFQTPIGGGVGSFQALPHDYVPGHENQVAFMSAFDRVQASPGR